MTAAAHSARAPRLRGLLAELRRRGPRLTAFGLACGACALLAFAAAAVDPRRFGGVPLWLKPAKFFLSIAIFSLSWAWFAGLVHPERRGSRTMHATAWTLIGTAAFELVYITLQAARGEASHFNVADVLLRVAHFLGLHAQQALPLALVAAGALGLRRRGVVLAVVAMLWTALTLAAFAQAVAGRRFPFG